MVTELCHWSGSRLPVPRENTRLEGLAVSAKTRPSRRWQTAPRPAPCPRQKLARRCPLPRLAALRGRAFPVGAHTSLVRRVRELRGVPGTPTCPQPTLARLGRPSRSAAERAAGEPALLPVRGQGRPAVRSIPWWSRCSTSAVPRPPDSQSPRQRVPVPLRQASRYLASATRLLLLPWSLPGCALALREQQRSARRSTVVPTPWHRACESTPTLVWARRRRPWATAAQQ